MNFSRAEYPVFLFCVFFAFLLLRAGGRVSAVARVALLLLLGDLAYLLLSKDLSSLWDPLGALVLLPLARGFPSLRSPIEYVAGLAVYGAAIAFGRHAAGRLDGDRWQHRLAIGSAIGLGAMGATLLVTSRAGTLDAMSGFLAGIGHLPFLLLLGITAGASLVEEGRAAGRLLLFFLVSCLFYHSWAAEMPHAYKYLLLLILGTITLDYALALWIDAAEAPLHRTLLLVLSLVSNLGVLALFKYFDFFLGIAGSASGALGLHFAVEPFALILPAGISFHTFQSLSYTIDVYQRKLRPTRSILEFATFVLFFPQLVAGPIVRAHEFMPQLEREPRLDADEAAEGLFRIVLGLFKKIALADFLAVALVDRVFAEPRLFSGVEVAAAVVGYALQIYFDFSAYSDIAIGSARLLGFHFPENFDTPYRSATLQEFWRRWHITLSSWLRDYLYKPLGGSRGAPWKTYRNLIITMLLGGLWHGASWAFIVWGALHGVGLAVTRLLQRRIEERAVDRGGRMALVLVGALATGAVVHWLLADELARAADRYDVPATWLHFALGWLYVTPAWAAANVWLDRIADELAARSATGKRPSQVDEDVASVLRPPLWRRARAAVQWLFLAGSVGLLAALRWGGQGSWAAAVAAWFALALLVAASLTEMDRGRVAAGLRWGAARGGAVLLTFVYVCAAWVFFRASTFDSARQIFAQLATLSTDAVNLTPPILLALALGATLHFFPTPTLDWLRRSFVRLPAPARAVVLVAAALVLRSLARPTVVPFIYFQF